MKKKHIPMPLRYGINAALIVAALAIGNALVTGGALGRAQTSIVMQIGIYMILAVSLNMATGYLGQLPLGHAGFMAVGAYTAGIFWKSGVPIHTGTFLAGVLLAAVVAGVVGILIGIPALRLKGDYLAIITLGFGEIIRIAIVNLSGLTGGAPGLKTIPKQASFLKVYLCVAFTLMIIHMIMKSRHGRAILSIRENEIAAEACGIPTTYYKVMAFAVSAGFAGVAGALYATNMGIIAPGEFGFMQSINILVMVVLGGMGSMLGSALAAGVLTALPLALQRFNEYRMVIFSALLVVVMIFKPSGLLGTYDFSVSRILSRIMNGADTQEGGERP